MPPGRGRGKSWEVAEEFVKQERDEVNRSVRVLEKQVGVGGR